MKVTVTKEVSEAIEYLRAKFVMYNDDSVFIEKHAESRSNSDDSQWVGEASPLNNVPTDVFARAILNGYVLEKSPEEKVRDQFLEITSWQRKHAVEGEYTKSDARVDGFLMALDLLGIKSGKRNGK